jgi:ketosteroid isomerase-like protein
MKTTLLITFALLISSISVFAQDSDFARSDVGKALGSYDEAWNKKDVDAVSRMLTDDYVYFSSTGGHVDRKATLSFLGSPDYKLTFVERSEIKLISKTDTVAVVSSRWKGKGTYGKETINDDQRCGLVFVKMKREWKLISEHCTQIATK